MKKATGRMLIRPVLLSGIAFRGGRPF